jgi:hypothetical protein
MSSRTTQILSIMLGVAFVAACENDIPPRSTSEFVENPIMLEAALVRCSQDRTATRYDAECINARQAISQIEAKEEAARRSEHEERSESKRKALRRTQEAAAQARRRSAEAERLREEAEYLAQFGVVPSTDRSIQEAEPETGNVPQAVIPASDVDNSITSGPGNTLPATDGGNAPSSAAEPEEKPASDLESIRDELQRRNEEGAN